MRDDSDEFDNSGTSPRHTRRWMLKMAAAGAAAVPVSGLLGGVSQAAPQSDTGNGATAAGGLPGLPKDFWHTFTSRYVSVDGMRLHAVTGGSGPAVLLICGWPQTWYTWRDVLPALAKDFTVVAMDPRGVGLSDKPVSGYDSTTLANDAVDLMKALGHEHFALVSHDVGAWTGYALASEHSASVDRYVAMETITPGLTDPGDLLLPGSLNTRLWHFPFNRVEGINEQLVQGREEIYFGYQFATKAATPTSVPAEVVRVYVDALKHPGALRGSFEFYRAIDQIIAQNTERKKTKLTMPVLAVGGEFGVGAGVGTELRTVAENVTSVVLPAIGHFLMDEGPEEVIGALDPFLAPYRSH
jgi:pimeloyl-ACP methyl ester carboxylesterase